MATVVPFIPASSASLKSAALGYASLGFRVFPIKEASKSPPLIKKWPDQATVDVGTIASWWRRWPNANIGIATGEKSGFFVVDVDARSGGEASLDQLCERSGDFPTTAMQITGGGRHLLFRSIGPVKNSASTIAPGIDIRGDGGYIVAAPSVHPSGLVYKWGVEPHCLAEPPGWLIGLLNGSANLVSSGSATPEGQRNEALFKYGCSLRNQGTKRIEVTAELYRHNDLNCRPPLPDEEVSNIIENVFRYFNEGKKPLFRYRDYVRNEAPKDSTLRLILHSISFYMDADGKPAYPTEEQLAQDTALSRETVSRKLKEAANDGHIIIKKHKQPGQRYSNNIYLLPKRFQRDSEP